MISHKYKCIFIHIPRCAGTSMETTFGFNMNDIISEKHTSALEAKELYKKYWNNYYKFSFVRNPYDRFMSMVYFADNHPNSYYPTGELNNLLELAKTIIPAAHEYRSLLQSNILNHELDFIGRFENIKEDFNTVRSTIGLTAKLSDKFQARTKYKTKHHWGKMTPEIKGIVRVRWLKDFERFGYKQ